MKYIKRKEWGAIESGRRLSPFRIKPVGIVVHHTTGSSKDPWKRVKQHDSYHVRKRGWKSIAYNFLVSGETGEIFEGRGWHQGAATYGVNYKTISIAYIGSGDDLSDKGKDALIEAVDGVRKKYGDKLYVKCHRDFAKTYCPADAIASWVKGGMVKDHNPSQVDWNLLGKYIEDIGRELARKPLRKRSRGKYVVLLQQQLNTRIRSGLVCDGIFGRKTFKAVVKFQRNYPIVIDGIVGPVTWRYLWTA